MSEKESNGPSRWRLWAGRVASALVTLMMLASAAMKLSHGDEVVKGFVEHLGYRESALTGIGVVELLCTVLYVVPRTSILGAVLLTGYLGGAVATHVRAGDPFVSPLVIGVLVWVGLFLRDERLRALMPLRSPQAAR